VQAPRQFDDEADAGLQGGAAADAAAGFVIAHPRNDAVLSRSPAMNVAMYTIALRFPRRIAAC
jgi:hypothetical protein